ncbi:MAG: hypothetical protein EAY66_07135 [Sphingobacteriales bacterium]|nr:MAG: hypothetical protein EAY66_07135 [Sphingobacteriales bacterium]
MKNTPTTISPYLMLLIPVIIFIGISFGIKQELSKSNSQALGYGMYTKTQMVIKQYPNKFIQLLLKK